MVTGVLFAVLKELHTDHIVLSDSTDIPFAEGLIVGQIGAGSRVMVVYSRDDSDGGMLAQSITRRA